jgi:O-6-methylguanine DNA methyltransferase
VYSFTLSSPIGLLYLSVTGRGLRRLHTLTHAHALDGVPVEPGDALAARPSAAEEAMASRVQRQVREYFDGDRRDFDLPLDVDTGSTFQRRVWEVIARIPYGEVLSYAEVAQAAGAPGAFRAAGTACGHNPIALVTPCHRVIASGSRLGGYGLGIENKVWLLRHEGVGATSARPDARVFKLEPDATPLRQRQSGARSKQGKGRGRGLVGV